MRRPKQTTRCVEPAQPLFGVLEAGTPLPVVGIRPFILPALARFLRLVLQDLLRELRRKNKALREELGSAQKTAKEAQLRRTTGRDAAKVSAQLLAVRSQHDTFKHKAKSLAKQYKTLRDELQVLTREETAQTRDNPQARRIRQLENRLDKAMIKFNEAQSIRKTYEQIVRRLREERVGFDTQLGAIEKSLQAKLADLEELQQLAQEANHAKDVALAELDKTKALALDEKEKRLKGLREKKGMAAARAKMNTALKVREEQRADRVMAMHGDLDAAAEEQLQASVQDQRREEATLQEQAAEARRRVERFEAAFQKIREATGVKDENEVIQKIVAQKEQYHSLQQLTRDNAQRVEELHAEQAELKEHLDALKFAGGDGRAGSRQLIDSLDTQLKTSLKGLAAAKDRHDRITKTLVELRAGSAHLREKVAGLRREQGMMGIAPAQRPRAADSAYAGSAEGKEQGGDPASEAAVVDLEAAEGVLVAALSHIRKFARQQERERAETAAEAAAAAEESPVASGGMRTPGGELPSAVARALGLEGTSATGNAAAAMGSEMASQLGLHEEDVAVLRETNLRVAVKPARPTPMASMRAVGAMQQGAAAAAAAADNAPAATDGGTKAGEEDDYGDDGFEQDAVSHTQVKHESQQAVRAHQHQSRKGVRRGKVDTEPPRYLE